MKKVLYIITLLLLMPPALYGADICEPGCGRTPLFSESRAAWERESESHIWDRKVIRDFRSGRENGFRLNALCSDEAFAEIEAIRGLAVSVIKDSIESGFRGRESGFARLLLERCAGYMPGGISEYEKGLVSALALIPEGARSEERDFTGPRGRPFNGYLAAASPVLFFSNMKIPGVEKTSRCTENSIPVTDVSGVRLGYLWDRERADYYRIFLYIRDDDGESFSSVNLIFPSGFFFPPIPFLSTFSNSSHQTIQQQKISEPRADFCAGADNYFSGELS